MRQQCWFGSPFQLEVQEAWAEVTGSGAAPQSKDRLKVWASGKKVFVMPEDKPEDEEHFSISPLFTLKSGVERREKAPESEDREEEESSMIFD